MPTTPRTPFRIAQPIDEVLYVMKRTRRDRLSLEITAREGVFYIDPKKKNDTRIQKELEGLSIDLTQNLTIRYFLRDCTLKFKRYRGLDGKGHLCYRIIHIAPPEDMESSSVVRIPQIGDEPNKPDEPALEHSNTQV